MEGPIRWTIPRSHVRARLKLVLPLILLSLAGAFFVKEALEAALIFVVFGGLLVAATVYAFVARERRYELRDDGFVEQVGERPPRLRRWSEFTGYSTHAEASTRRVRGVAQRASVELGETYLLRPKSSWSWGASLPTTRETSDAVRAELQRRLPHRPGAHVNALVVVLTLAMLLVVIAVVVIGIAMDAA